MANRDLNSNSEWKQLFDCSFRGLATLVCSELKLTLDTLDELVILVGLYLHRKTQSRETRTYIHTYIQI